MSSDSESSSPEVPAPDVPPPQVVDDQPVAPPPDPAPQAAPEPPPPFWTGRKYIGRAFGFKWEGVELEGSFYRLDTGSIDCDGIWSGREFESTSHLMTLMGARSEALVSKIRSYLA